MFIWRAGGGSSSLFRSNRQEHHLNFVIEAHVEYFLLTLFLQSLHVRAQITQANVAEIYRHTHTYRLCVHWNIQMWQPLENQDKQLDIHICPNWELYKLLSSSQCQQNVNQHPSFSLQYKQTRKCKPFFSLQRQSNHFLRL